MLSLTSGIKTIVHCCLWLHISHALTHWVTVGYGGGTSGLNLDQSVGCVSSFHLWSMIALNDNFPKLAVGVFAWLFSNGLWTDCDNAQSKMKSENSLFDSPQSEPNPGLSEREQSLS